MSNNNDCIFCKIINGQISCSRIYEDKDVLAFLDIAPVSKGHALVVPKQHCKNFIETPHDIICKCVDVIKKIAPAITLATGSEGFNVGVNNGRAAGQVVFHTHFHIIPRITNDGLINWTHSSYTAGEMEKVQKLIISATNEEKIQH